LFDIFNYLQLGAIVTLNFCSYLDGLGQNYLLKIEIDSGTLIVLGVVLNEIFMISGSKLAMEQHLVSLPVPSTFQSSKL
jgi:hypothetical protein